MGNNASSGSTTASSTAPKPGAAREFKSKLKRASQWLRESFVERATFGRRLRNCDPVLVFQMGKVASTSVYYAIKENYRGAAVHTHWLKPDHLDWQVRRFYNEVFAARRPFRIVSLTREPIGRNLSAFFQNYEELTGTARGEVSFSVAELTEIFLDKYHHDFPLTWFEENIARLFDIDVYAEPFPNSGYCEYRQRNVRLLVIRSELDDDQKAVALREFLEIPQLAIRPRNISARKEYGDDYGHFKRNVTIPLDYIERMCDSRYFRHFYDEPAIETVRAKWMRKLESLA